MSSKVTVKISECMRLSDQTQWVTPSPTHTSNLHRDSLPSRIFSRSTILSRSEQGDEGGKVTYRHGDIHSLPPRPALKPLATACRSNAHLGQ